MIVDTTVVPSPDSSFALETIIETGSTAPKRRMKEQERARQNVLFPGSYWLLRVPRVVGEGGDSQTTETTLIQFDSGMNPSGRSTRESRASSLRERFWQSLSTYGLMEGTGNAWDCLAERVFRDTLFVSIPGEVIRWEQAIAEVRAKAQSHAKLIARYREEFEEAHRRTDSNDEALVEFGQLVDAILMRGGVEAVRAIGEWIRFARAREWVWTAISRVGRCDDSTTTDVRRGLLIDLLGSEHVGVQYAAASALEYVVDDAVRAAAQRYLKSDVVPSLKAALQALVQ